MENKEKYALNASAYDEIADEWHKFRKTCKVNKCVKEFCSLLPEGANVLDAGCGTGYPISAYLSECGFKVTGFDPSEKMLEKNKGSEPQKRRILQIRFSELQDKPFIRRRYRFRLSLVYRTRKTTRNI